jgi:hypothetical protein
MADVRVEGGSLIRTMPDKVGREGSENPSFGRTSFVNGLIDIDLAMFFIKYKLLFNCLWRMIEPPNISRFQNLYLSISVM